MSDKKVLAAFLAATVAVAGGSAWAATESASSAPPQTATQKDYGKLSADGAKAYQDLTLTRLAIYDGQTDKAKTYVGDADKAFDKAKADDSVFMKAEDDLKTPQQVATKTSGKAADKTVADSPTASDKPVAGPIKWLPVDGAISLNEDYTLNPTKTKAVADANKKLAKGDKNGAVDSLKLAGVDTSVVLEVVPLDQTLSDVHQAAQMIDSGKYYEGSQMLRKVQMSARYNVLNLVDMPKAAAANKDAGSNAAPKAPDASTKPAPTH